jgi:hypothetical protein
MNLLVAGLDDRQWRAGEARAVTFKPRPGRTPNAAGKFLPLYATKIAIKTEALLRNPKDQKRIPRHPRASGLNAYAIRFEFPRFSIDGYRAIQ